MSSRRKTKSSAPQKAEVPGDVPAPARANPPVPSPADAPVSQPEALPPGAAAHREVPQFVCVAPTKQPPELCCISCGAFLGHDRPLVQVVQAAWRLRHATQAKCLLEFAPMLPNSTPVLGPLFDALGWNRICCRTQLLSSYPHAGQRALEAEDLKLP